MSRRKRLSRKEREEEERMQRKRFWIGLFVMFVMVIGSVGFIATSLGGGGGGGAQSGYGFNYEIRDDLVYVRTDGGEVPFYSMPQGVPVSSEVRELLRGASSVAISFNASDEENLPYVELARWDLSNYLRAPTTNALLAPSEEYSFEVVTCADATAQRPVIVFRSAPGSSVSLEGSCVVVGGQELGVLFSRDALLYNYYELVQ